MGGEETGVLEIPTQPTQLTERRVGSGVDIEEAFVIDLGWQRLRDEGDSR